MHTYRVTLAYVPFAGEHFSRTSHIECRAVSHEQAERAARGLMPLACSMAHTVTVEQLAQGRAHE